MNDPLEQLPKSGEPWSLEDATALYHHRTMGTPYEEIAKILGRTKQACWDKYRNTVWENTGIPDVVQEKIKERRTKTFEEYNKAIADNRLAFHRQRTDLIADQLCRAIDSRPPIEQTPWKPKTQQEGTPEHMGLVLSDLHIGHDHSYEETGGLSEYNIDVFKQRMKNLQYAVADIYQHHSIMYKIPHLHIFCLGDLVDGMNAAGKWSPTYISHPIVDQVGIGVIALSDAIQYWLTVFENITFYGVRGNHGRVAPSGVEKDYCNWDNIIYQHLEAEYRNNDRISFNSPKCWYNIVEIQNHNFYICHGDDVKSKGTPVQGLLDVKNKMQATVNQRLHYGICGHFHNAGEIASHSGRVIVNGSFVGSDVYSLKNNLPGTRAEQKLFGIHNRRGITYTYNINLDDERADPNAESTGVGETVST